MRAGGGGIGEGRRTSSSFFTSDSSPMTVLIAISRSPTAMRVRHVAGWRVRGTAMLFGAAGIRPIARGCATRKPFTPLNVAPSKLKARRPCDAVIAAGICNGAIAERPSPTRKARSSWHGPLPMVPIIFHSALVHGVIVFGGRNASHAAPGDALVLTLPAPAHGHGVSAPGAPSAEALVTVGGDAAPARFGHAAVWTGASAFQAPTHATARSLEGRRAGGDALFTAEGHPAAGGGGARPTRRARL